MQIIQHTSMHSFNTQNILFNQIQIQIYYIYNILIHLSISKITLRYPRNQILYDSYFSSYFKYSFVFLYPKTLIILSLYFFPFSIHITTNLYGRITHMDPQRSDLSLCSTLI